MSQPFAELTWFVVPSAETILVGGQVYHGYTWVQDRRIVLAEKALLHGALVRHEMLHALVGPEHSANLFRDACGGLVACDGQCASDVGEVTPAVDAPRITADQLERTVTVRPKDSTISGDSGWVTVIVTATNPSQSDVWVELTRPPQAAALTFGYRLECADMCKGHLGGVGEDAYVYADRLGFRAGESRRQAFDAQVDAGTWVVQGFFNERGTTQAPVVIRP